MARADLIPPFPADIDRNAFGHWLSGFVDGEGCFWLGLNNSVATPYRTAFFSIKLRADDAEILKTAQSFLGCGRLIVDAERGCQVPNARPQVSFTVCKIADLHHKVVPHFEAFPLRAKKSRDFQIWKRAVALLYVVRSMRRHNLCHAKGPGGHFRGIRAKWTPELENEFSHLVTLLRETRRMSSPKTVIMSPAPEPSVANRPLPLFERLRD